MLQTVKSLGPTYWPDSVNGQVIDNLQPRGRTAPRSRAEPRLTSADDLTRLHPESILTTSDPLSWRDVRAVRLRHGAEEMCAPRSDRHCLVLNTGAQLRLDASHNQRRFEGVVGAGEVAYVPATEADLREQLRILTEIGLAGDLSHEGGPQVQEQEVARVAALRTA